MQTQITFGAGILAALQGAIATPTWAGNSHVQARDNSAQIPVSAPLPLDFKTCDNTTIQVSSMSSSKKIPKDDEIRKVQQSSCPGLPSGGGDCAALESLDKICKQYFVSGGTRINNAAVDAVPLNVDRPWTDFVVTAAFTAPTVSDNPIKAIVLWKDHTMVDQNSYPKPTQIDGLQRVEWDIFSQVAVGIEYHLEFIFTKKSDITGSVGVFHLEANATAIEAGKAEAGSPPSLPAPSASSPPPGHEDSLYQ